MAVPEASRTSEQAPTSAQGQPVTKPGGDAPSKSLDKEGANGEDGDDHSHGCLTQKRACVAQLSWATVEPTRAVSSARMASSRSGEETVDAKKPSCSESRESWGNMPETAHETVPEPPATGSTTPYGAQTSHPAPGPVFTSAARVRVALEHARRGGHPDAVIWGRCAKCGRVGQVVHFDGGLRARARAP